jgi:WD40 repeat protein
MKLWDMETYRCVGNLIAHTAGTILLEYLAVKGLCGIPDESNNIASCGADKKVVVWDIDCKQPCVVVELDGH